MKGSRIRISIVEVAVLSQKGNALLGTRQVTR